MHPSSVRTQLITLTRELAVRWHETAESWTDVKRDEFEHQFLDPLWTAVDRAANALERLDEIVTTARHDCE